MLLLPAVSRDTESPQEGTGKGRGHRGKASGALQKRQVTFHLCLCHPGDIPTMAEVSWASECQMTSTAICSLPPVTHLTLLCLKPPAAVNPWQTSSTVQGREPGTAHLPSPEHPGQNGIPVTALDHHCPVPATCHFQERNTTQPKFPDCFSAAPAVLLFPPKPCH